VSNQPSAPIRGRRIVICDYSALLLSVCGILRMVGYCVFQARDALAAEELCLMLPDIALVIVNEEGPGADMPQVIRHLRTHVPAMPVLHIGRPVAVGLPDNVPTLAAGFTLGQLLLTVGGLTKASPNGRPPRARKGRPPSR
jgi:hypothetical protein